MRTPTLSPSQLDSMSCRLSWHWGYREGYSAKRSSLALELGTGIHAALEAYYGKQKPLVESFTEWADKRMKEISALLQGYDLDEFQKEFLEAKALGEAMLTGYLEEYKQEDFDVLATERMVKKQLPIPWTEDLADCFLNARLDGLVRERETNHIFVLEHKTFDKFQSSFMDMDHQMTAQAWLGQQVVDDLGVEGKFMGVIYNGLRKQAPGPKVKLKLFERHKILRTQRQIEVFLHRAYCMYDEMLAPHKNVQIYPEPNMVRCNMCDFKEPCLEYQRGGDVDFILKEMYTKRKR